MEQYAIDGFRLLEEVTLLNEVTFNENEQVYVFTLDRYKLFLANKQALIHLGCRLEELHLLTFSDVINENDEERLQSLIEILIDGKKDVVTFKTTIKQIDQLSYPVVFRMQLIRMEGQLLVLAIATDAVDQAKMIEQLAKAAYKDCLMNIPNRLLFYDRLQLAMSQAKRSNGVLAVLYLDLDRFKNINNLLGHKMGDRLLHLVSDRLQSYVRENDTVSRFGGDEFVFFFTNIPTIDVAVKLSQRILQAFSKPFQIENDEFFISTSIGVSIYPDDGTEIDSLLKNAETAMYKAKELGGNHYQFYDSNMNSKVFAKLIMENHLRKAIEKNELSLHYQPLVNVINGEVVGVEALIRWNNPELGMVPPADFIPLAEEIGAIVSVGEWVLRTACRQLKEWHEAGLTSLYVAVNISARQLKLDKFSLLIRNILKKTDLAPEFLHLEITETSVMENSSKSVQAFNELKNMGVRISIDDFGTGYSSLSYLKQLTADTLKIDRSFIKDIAHSPDNKEIVTAIIKLAHTLGIKVIAEGVEEREQSELLSSMQCDLLQGYFISVPLKAPDFDSYMSNNNYRI